MSPHLSRTVHADVGSTYLPDQLDEDGATPNPRWQASRIGLPRVVHRWGDQQPLTDWLDPVLVAVLVDERDLHFGRRSSSAWAKDVVPCTGSRWPGAPRACRAQVLDALALGRTWVIALAQITLGLTHPAAQRLPRAADLACHRLDRRPLRRMLVLMLQEPPNRALTHLQRVPLVHFDHDSIHSRIGVSGKVGAVRQGFRLT